MLITEPYRAAQAHSAPPVSCRPSRSVAVPERVYVSGQAGPVRDCTDPEFLSKNNRVSELRLRYRQGGGPQSRLSGQRGICELVRR